MPLVMQVQTNRQTEKPAAFVRLTVSLAEPNSTYPFHLSASMDAYFWWEDDLPAELVNALLQENAPSLLLSYLRPYIAQITGTGSGSAIHIPFMNFTRGEVTGDEGVTSK